MRIKCGNHAGQDVRHSSVAEVRDCYAGQTPFGVSPSGETVGSLSQSQSSITSAVLENLRGHHARVAMSKGSLASSLADRGLAPAKPNTESLLHSGVPLVSAAQINYLRALLAEREIPPGLGAWAEQVEGELGDDKHFPTLGRREVSDAISTLKSLPYRSKKSRDDYGAIYSDGAVEAPKLADRDGMYRNPGTGEIFRIQWNRASGDGRHMYVKQLVLEYYIDGSFITEIPLAGQAPAASLTEKYVGSITKAGVLADWRMKIEDAEKFGALYGQCLRCRRVLTAAESIARAMGPICSGRENWA